MLCFDVEVTREAQQMADSLGLQLFTAQIIYHLFDAFTKYIEDYTRDIKERHKHLAMFPCGSFCRARTHVPPRCEQHFAGDKC